MENRWLVLTIGLLLLTSVMGMAVPGTALAVNEPTRLSSSPLPPSALPARPNPPTNLVATAIAPGAIQLTWRDNSNNEEIFFITRKTGASGTYTGIKQLGINVTSYVDKNLNAETTYSYLVCANNKGGMSTYSNEASATTPPVQGGPPKAPSDLTATVVSPILISLNWKDNSTNEVGFWVEKRRAASSSWSMCMAVKANITSYPTIGQEPNTTYYYRVYAQDAAGKKSYSNEVMVTTPPKTTPPPSAPSNLTATAAALTVKLAWNDNSNNENEFYVERRDGASGAWRTIDSVSLNRTNYTDTLVSRGNTYYYRITASNKAGNSAYSNEASVTTPAGTTPPPPSGIPNAPSNLVVTLVPPFDLKWSFKDNSTNEDGFRQERKIGTGPWSGYGEFGPNVTSSPGHYGFDRYTPYVANITYYFRVYARNKNGNSGYSNEVSITTPPCSSATIPAAPKLGGGNGIKNGAAISNLNPTLVYYWGDYERSAPFELQVATDPIFTKVIKGLSTPNIKYDITSGLNWNTTYYWRVRAKNVCGYSPWSPVWSFKTN